MVMLGEWERWVELALLCAVLCCVVLCCNMFAARRGAAEV